MNYHDQLLQTIKNITKRRLETEKQLEAEKKMTEWMELGFSPTQDGEDEFIDQLNNHPSGF